MYHRTRVLLKQMPIVMDGVYTLATSSSTDKFTINRAAELLRQTFKHHFRMAITLRPPWWSVEESDPAEVSRLGEGSRRSSNGSQGGPRYCEPPNYFKRSTNLQGLLTQQKGEYDTEQLLCKRRPSRVNMFFCAYIFDTRDFYLTFISRFAFSHHKQLCCSEVLRVTMVKSFIGIKYHDGT